MCNKMYKMPEQYSKKILDLSDKSCIVYVYTNPSTLESGADTAFQLGGGDILNTVRFI